MTDFGPHRYEASLKIDPRFYPRVGPLAVDVETDEKDNFVGVGLCLAHDTVSYYTKITGPLREVLSTLPLITHGGKFDIRMFRKWGVPVPSKNVHADTAAMANLLDSTKKSYKLKDLAKESLNMIWPTYKDMVGVGKKKKTLDQQPVERVANYCGMDALATFKLYRLFRKRMTERQAMYFYEIEMPVFRVLLDMEEKGVFVDTASLHKLDVKFEAEANELEQLALKHFPEPINLRSPLVLKDALRKLGIKVKSTNINELLAFSEEPAIKDLLNYRQIFKLRSTYTQGLLKQTTLPYIHSNFSLHRTITGRLASDHPNLQNIPARTEVGRTLRKSFCISKPDHKLLCFDYNQVEYRLFAHFTKDASLIESFHEGEDIHQTTANLIGVDRRVGKTINFAVIYGAQPKKISKTAGISEAEAETALNTYWAKLPKAASWITRVKWKARKDKGVATLKGRFIPLLGIDSRNPFERGAKERQAVNYIIQGSAAEVVKLAMVKLGKLNIIPLLQVHDELLFEIKESEIREKKKQIVHAMESVCVLNVPLVVDYGEGLTWGDCK